jgi:ABC-type nitrate/sulfonate/bicarbonate transport system substrate-binding protein
MRARILSLSVVVAAIAVMTFQAKADGPLRVGKAVPYPFVYAGVDAGQSIGAFKKRDLDVELTSFTGAAKLQQGMIAGSVDIGISGGSDMAFEVKGAPVMAIAATYIGNALGVLVPMDTSLKTVGDLKGKTLAIAGTGSVTQWMALELARQKGWGPDGIKTVAVGSSAAQLEAVKTHQLDGIVTDVTTGYRFEESGDARIFVRFSDYVPDLILSTIFVRSEFLKTNPDQVRRFMLAWFDTVQFMRNNRDATIKLVAPVMDVSAPIAARTYDELMAGYSTTGRFTPAGLKVLSRSWVDMGTLDSEPDMSKLYTEEYLPPNPK